MKHFCGGQKAVYERFMQQRPELKERTHIAEVVHTIDQIGNIDIAYIESVHM